MTVLRSTLFNVYFFGVTAVLTVIGSLMTVVLPGRIYGIAVLWARAVIGGARIICGIRLEVIGGETLPTAGPALIAPLHQSAFDTVVWLTLLPRCCYVLKQELARIPLFGLLTRKSGMITVDRAAGAASMRHLLREADRVVREGRQIVIFPEGTRGAPGAPLPLQPGVAALAGRTGLAVIPVVTDSGWRWGRRAFHKHSGVIHIRILPPIPACTPREILMQKLDFALRTEVGPPPGSVEKFVG